MSSINYEDLAEFSKSQGHKQDSELNRNRQVSFLAGEFYTNNSVHFKEELARIGALIRLFLEKTQSEAGKDRQDFSGMFILEAEANSILQAVCCDSGSCEEQG